jgi:hypothetical protein
MPNYCPVLEGSYVNSLNWHGTSVPKRCHLRFTLNMRQQLIVGTRLVGFVLDVLRVQYYYSILENTRSQSVIVPVLNIQL